MKVNTVSSGPNLAPGSPMSSHSFGHAWVAGSDDQQHRAGTWHARSTHSRTACQMCRSTEAEVPDLSLHSPSSFLLQPTPTSVTAKSVQAAQTCIGAKYLRCPPSHLNYARLMLMGLPWYWQCGMCTVQTPHLPPTQLQYCWQYEWDAKDTIS